MILIRAVVPIPLHDDAAGHRAFRAARPPSWPCDDHAAGMLPRWRGGILHLLLEPSEEPIALVVGIEAGLAGCARSSLGIDELELAHPRWRHVFVRQAQGLADFARSAATATRITFAVIAAPICRSARRCIESRARA